MPGRTCLAGLVFASAAWLAPASAQTLAPSIPPLDYPAVMGAYVDGVVELRQFVTACGPGDPPRWEEGAELLIASLTKFGFVAAGEADFRTRLVGASADTVRYDCSGEVAKRRKGVLLAPDWVTYHSEMLKRLGIPIVAPPPKNDPRIAAVRTVIAAHKEPHARMLSCMAVTLPDFFAPAYGEWNSLVDQAFQAVRQAGYDARTAEELIGPVRPAQLLRLPVDRQAAIAECMTNNDWMTRHATFQWYGLAGDVREALGLPR